MKRTSIGILFIVLIASMIGYVFQTTEGFVSTLPSKVMVDQPFRAYHCGVDLPSCKGKGVRCMNGYCRSDRID